jgi:hypothetical protein
MEGGKFSTYMQKCEKRRVKNVVVQHIARLYIVSDIELTQDVMPFFVGYHNHT